MSIRMHSRYAEQKRLMGKFMETIFARGILYHQFEDVNVKLGRFCCMDYTRLSHFYFCYQVRVVSIYHTCS